MNIVDILAAKSKTTISIASLLLIAFIGYFDVVTGSQIALSIFYVIPIAMVTWFVGGRPGIIVSLLCAGIWYFADQKAGAQYAHFMIPVWNAVVRALFFLLFVYLMASLKYELNLQKNMAMEDFLTKASNSRAFFRYADMEIKRMRRYGTPFSLVYFDLDNFKQVNDSQGHNEGDRLLYTTVNIIRKNIRATDAIARLGGDEFAILLPEMNADSALPFVKHVRAVFNTEMKNNNWPVTFSAGVVTFIKPPESIDAVIKLADNLMYTVKRQGKNAEKYIIYD
jgi:diguanylate cyclase (GGDEF)-like protein